MKIAHPRAAMRDPLTAIGFGPSLPHTSATSNLLEHVPSPITRYTRASSLVKRCQTSTAIINRSALLSSRQNQEVHTSITRLLKL